MMKRRGNRHHKRNDWKRYLDVEGMPSPIWGDADRVSISAIYTLCRREPEDLVRHLGAEFSKRLIFALQAAGCLEAELPQDPQTPSV